MKWILIILITTWYGGGPAMQEFNTRDACIRASEAVKTMKITGGPSTYETLCVPKG